MSNTKTGGPAFPTEVWDYDADGNGLSCSEGGMTLRDYFAAKAMQGLCAGFSSQDEDWPRDDDLDGYEVAAGHAYLMADAMLKARDAKT